MKTIISLFTAIILTSCTSILDDDHFYIEDRLKPYVDKFYKEAVSHGKKIQHENLLVSETYALTQKSGAAGQSFRGDIPRVRIASDLLDEGDTLKIQFVVFHELGHALLFRDHVDKYDFSIMVPGDYRIADFKNTDQRKELIDELFR